MAVASDRYPTPMQEDPHGWGAGALTAGVPSTAIVNAAAAGADDSDGVDLARGVTLVTLRERGEPQPAMRHTSAVDRINESLVARSYVRLVVSWRRVR